LQERTLCAMPFVKPAKASRTGRAPADARRRARVGLDRNDEVMTPAIPGRRCP